MAISHTVTYIVDAGGSQIRQAIALTADGEDNREISVPDAQTDMLVAFTLDISQLKHITIISDKAITIETNSGSAPDDTIVLVANEPLIWTNVSKLANPFSADITALYFTNASGATATVKIRCLVDVTV